LSIGEANVSKKRAKKVSGTAPKSGRFVMVKVNGGEIRIDLEDEPAPAPKASTGVSESSFWTVTMGWRKEYIHTRDSTELYTQIIEETYPKQKRFPIFDYGKYHEKTITYGGTSDNETVATVQLDGFIGDAIRKITVQKRDSDPTAFTCPTFWKRFEKFFTKLKEITGFEGDFVRMTGDRGEDGDVLYFTFRHPQGLPLTDSSLKIKAIIRESLIQMSDPIMFFRKHMRPQLKFFHPIHHVVTEFTPNFRDHYAPPYQHIDEDGYVYVRLDKVLNEMFSDGTSIPLTRFIRVFTPPIPDGAIEELVAELERMRIIERTETAWVSLTPKGEQLVRSLREMTAPFILYEQPYGEKPS
jgi:hypothetical protein